MSTTAPSSATNSSRIHSAVALTAGGRKIELGKYQIISLLGQGGFGITYLAKNQETGQDVVIKENLPPDFAHRDSKTLIVEPIHNDVVADFKWAMDSFLKEAGLLKQLDHPNIVSVLDAFAALGTAYYVMPWVGGSELRQMAPPPAEITEAWLAPVLRQLLEGLQYLHSKNMLHRDIKPSNILMSDSGAPVLIDFGSARAIISEKSATKVGSPGYTPFEQVQTHGKCGPWTDIYALGATFYRVITGERPPKCEDRIGKADCYHALAPRAELYKRFSRSFLASVDKALSLWPEDRWKSSGEWMTALTQATEQNTPSAEPISIRTSPLPPPVFIEDEPPPAEKKNGSMKAVLVVLLLLLIGGGLYKYIDIQIEKAKEQAALAAQAEAQKEAEKQRLKAEAEAKAKAEAEAKARELAEAERKKAEAEAVAKEKAEAEARARALAEREIERQRHLQQRLSPKEQAAADLKKRNIFSWEYDIELRKAAAQGDLELVLLLLTAGADINKADSSGFTPLMKAAEQNQSTIINTLLDKGANARLKSNDGKTAYDIALQKNQAASVSTLISKGANYHTATVSTQPPRTSSSSHGNMDKWVDAYNAMNSTNNVSYVYDYFDEPIHLFKTGQNITRDELYELQKKFVKRWPYRRYDTIDYKVTGNFIEIRASYRCSNGAGRSVSGYCKVAYRISPNGRINGYTEETSKTQVPAFGAGMPSEAFRY